MNTIKQIYYDFVHGTWDYGFGWWKGSAKLFACDRTYYDGYWYGFRLGPFWVSCGPY